MSNEFLETYPVIGERASPVLFEPQFRLNLLVE